MAIHFDFDSHSRTVFIVTTSTIILATLFVLARLISRFGVLRKHAADDWLIILAWVRKFSLDSFSVQSDSKFHYANSCI